VEHHGQGVEGDTAVAGGVGVKVSKDIIGGEIVLSVAPTSSDLVQVERNETRLEDGRRIVLRLRRPRQQASSAIA